MQSKTPQREEEEVNLMAWLTVPLMLATAIVGTLVYVIKTFPEFISYF